MRKKLTMAFLAMLAALGVQAADYTVTYGTGTGSYTATNAAGTWASKWESTATNPKVTLSTTANNIAVSTGYIYSGGSGCTYTLTAQAGYIITGYTITGKAQGGAQTLTPAEGGSALSFGTDQDYTLAVTGLAVSSTTFQQSTPNQGIALSSFTVSLTEDPTCHWTPSLASNLLITSCTKVTDGSLATATEAADNSHWYIMTQVRNGESAMYDSGTTPVKRAGTTYTADYFVGKKAAENAAYLVRFIATETDGIYNIQFATGSFISASLGSTNEANAGNYAVYFTDGASAVAWNLNSKSGSRVDNNGAGNGLAFWGSGENTATSGNNIWTLYEAEVIVPSFNEDLALSIAQARSLIAYGIPADAPIADLQAAIATAEGKVGSATAEDVAAINAAIDAFNTALSGNTSNSLYLPDGYYYFKGMETSRYPYLYSNFAGKETAATFHHSPLAGLNGEVWKVKNNGTSITATNGEGLPLTIGSTAYETLNFGAYNGQAGIYFTEAINLTNWGNDTQLTTWAGHVTATDNRWTFEDADISAGIYDVVVTGTEDGYVTFNGQNAKNGGFFVAENIAAADLTAASVHGYEPSIAIEGRTITVTYAQVLAITTVTWDIYGDAAKTEKLGSYSKSGVVEGTEVTFDGTFAYTTINAEQEGITVTGGAADQTVDIVATVGEMPFTSSADAENAVWFTMRNVSRNRYPYYNSEDESFVPLAASLVAEDSYLWAFVGNPVAGYQILNKASGKSLFAATAGNAEIITWAETGSVFTLVEGTDAGNCGFQIGNFYLNDYAGNGKMSFWQDGPASDTGSRWIISTISTDAIKLAINVTGETEAENNRAGKITVTLNGASSSTFLYNTDTEGKDLVGYIAEEFTATATSYRGYDFTGFSVDGTDYGTSIEAGELSAIPAGSTIVANYVASTGNGLNLWYDYNDEMTDAYRLPAIIRTMSGRIIAFADYRPGNTDVGGGPTSIERRYSDDGGESWSPALRVAQGNWGVNTENVIEWSYGDPAAVADNTPGNSGNDVLMVCCGGNSFWTSSVYNPDTSQRQQGCVAWRSTDGGVTWGNYEYIQPALMQAFVDAGIRAADGSSGIVRSFFTSGRIIQSVRKAEGAQYNRIYNAVDVNGGDVVVYSDDFGQTWKVLGNQIANSGDEAHVVELPDGDILLVGKGSQSRYVNVFNYADFDTAEGTWGPTGQWNNAVATSCNGDVEMVEAYDSYGVKNTVIVETAPMTSSPQRREIQYYFIALPKATGFTTADFSTVGGASWTQGMNVTHNWGAYSILLGNGDGTMDILFEECAKDETKHPTGYCLIYQKNHDIKDITMGQYYFDKDEAEAEAVKMPRPGHFYRFKGSASGAYLTASGTTPLTTTTATDASTIWYYSTEGLISYSTGLSLNGSTKALSTVGTSYKAAIEPNTHHEGKYAIKSNGYYTYDKDSNNTIDRGSSYNNDVRYAWDVEDVSVLPVTISELGLATLYSPVGLTAPEGVKLYAATKNEAYSSIHFDEVEAVKAGTGVLVEGTAGTYDFTVELNETDYESDLLGSERTLQASSVAATVYTLQSGPAFKKYTGENLTGFRSHIEAEEGAGVKAFDVLFTDPTGIDNLEETKTPDGAIYNLAGQRLQKVRRGVNIVGGKKMVVGK